MRRLMGALALGVVAVVTGATGAGASPTVRTFTIHATGAGVGGGLGLRTSGYAKGTVSVNTATNQVCYRISDKGLGTIQAAHIHAGKAGVDGSVVVTLNIKKFNAKATRPTCVKVSAPIARALFKSPSLFYFNLHTVAFPSGAVRAQL